MNISFEEATSRCWAEVDLGRLTLNYKNALNHLKGNTQLICVLKADAYGLGAPMVAKRLAEEGARFFAVASYNEAEQIILNGKYLYHITADYVQTILDAYF